MQIDIKFIFMNVLLVSITDNNINCVLACPLITTECSHRVDTWFFYGTTIVDGMPMMARKKKLHLV